MSDKLPLGPVPPNFRGLQLSLFATSGSWWLEITPCPVRAEERLRRLWRSVFRVPFLDIDGPYTHEAFLLAVAKLAVAATEEHHPALERLR